MKCTHALCDREISRVDQMILCILYMVREKYVHVPVASVVL